MRRIWCHPVLKFLTLLLYAAATVAASFFVWEGAAVAWSSVDASITGHFWQWHFYPPVVFAGVAVSLTAVILLLTLLCSVAGRSFRDERPHLTVLNRIPFDLYLALVVLIVGVLLAATVDMSYQTHTDTDIFNFVQYILMALVPACALLLAMTLMSLAARIRAGTWWRNNVITYALRLAFRIVRWSWQLLCRVLRVLWRGMRRVGHAVWGFIVDIPTVPLTLAFIGSVLLFLLFSLWLPSAFLLIMTALYAIVGILLGAVFTSRLERGAERLARGDLETQIDVSNLFGPYRAHAEHLNHICRGMNDAVEAQLRSERMKTELITNVSHDIKTPLTSIINYVDLMKKEQIENETAREYLDIMDRQSTRLKKLIEDLIEVSKASTGNVAVELMPTDVAVLLEQALGEYRERLSAAGLTLCVNNLAPGAQMLADGKLLWRVFDNLLGNICKYSLSGTRVYLNVSVQDGVLEMTFRNISAYSLNITSEELMERFVRGDRARHTEGSGLGLSIAKNLVELQKGNLELVIDGDLFKATLRFPVL